MHRERVGAAIEIRSAIDIATLEPHANERPLAARGRVDTIDTKLVSERRFADKIEGLARLRFVVIHSRVTAS